MRATSPTAAPSRWAGPGSSIGAVSGEPAPATAAFTAVRRSDGDRPPMSELTLTLLRLGFLVLLWIMVLSVVAVLRRDLFGIQVTRRQTPPGPVRPGRNRPPSSPVPDGRPAGGGSVRSLGVTEGS